eukprot:TRINITY_DN13459_c0_g1_i1.p1 TRINITY_DN13459_c0_g1~~TRINITY_DN13459_c0_g1_i1.p1  ORF type:complete len:192 (-),score=37.66 TRINITY_DN13459_c0_g1_i1:39-581(-)
MPKKVTNAFPEDVVETRKVKPDVRTFYFLVGLVGAVIPGFLYYSQFNIPLNQWDLIVPLAIFTVVSAGVLSYAYEIYAYVTSEKLLKSAEAGKLAKVVKVVSADEKKSVKDVTASLKQQVESVTAREGSAWAVFIINTMFLIPSLLIGFYALRYYPLIVNIVISYAAANAWVLYVTRRAA